jgi:hypothetical protein
MQQQSTAESDTPRPLPGTPTVCSVCWNHDITPVENTRVLSVTGKTVRDVRRASVYRCGNWHVFALFDQP